MYLLPLYLINPQNKRRYENVDDIGDDAFNPLADGSENLVCYDSISARYLCFNQHEEPIWEISKISNDEVILKSSEINDENYEGKLGVLYLCPEEENWVEDYLGINEPENAIGEKISSSVFTYGVSVFSLDPENYERIYSDE